MVHYLRMWDNTDNEIILKFDSEKHEEDYKEQLKNTLKSSSLREVTRAILMVTGFIILITIYCLV
jgi:hypothetical protein